MIRHPPDLSLGMECRPSVPELNMHHILIDVADSAPFWHNKRTTTHKRKENAHPMDNAEPYAIDYRYMDKRRLETFFKKHQAETISCIDELKLTAERLGEGHPLGSFSRSQIRSEGGDLWRVAPRLAKRGRAEIRLYFWFCLIGKTLYPLTIGDKQTQEKDIVACKRRVKTLRS